MSVGGFGSERFVGTLVDAREMKTVSQGMRDERRMLVQSFLSAGDEVLLYL